MAIYFSRSFQGSSIFSLVLAVQGGKKKRGGADIKSLKRMLLKQEKMHNFL